MGDPLSAPGSQGSASVHVSETPETQETQPVKGSKFNRSVSVIQATPQKGLRDKVRDLIPKPLYQFVVTVLGSDKKAQYELGKQISQISKASARAWQKLGDLPKTEQYQKAGYLLQLECREKDLALDHLQGWGDSPVTAEKQKVISLLKECVANPEDSVAKANYLDGCKHLKKVEHDQDTLRLRRADLKKQIATLKSTIHSAEHIAVRQGLEQSGLQSRLELTEEAKKEEQTILDEAGRAQGQLKAVRAELAEIELDIKKHKKNQEHAEKAQEALFYYESVERSRIKGES